MIIFTLLLTGCNSGSSDEPEEVEKVDKSYLEAALKNQRKWLTTAELLEPQYLQPSPIHNSHFVEIGESTPITQSYSGKLTINESAILGTSANEDPRGTGYLFFPALSVEFFTQGEDFVPIQQDIIYSSGSNSFWGIILSPGKIWSEATDNGWLRVAFPFVLTDKLRSQTHNGIATFLMKGDEISRFRFQVVQETGNYFVHRYWGQINIALENSIPPNLEAKKAQFNRYVNAMPIVEKWQALEGKVSASLANSIYSNPNGSDYSAIGLYYDGTLYLQDCPTEYGNFPFCAQMRHGSFSVAKSMGAGMLLMWLTQKYGVAILDEHITDYLSIASTHSAWDKVTLRHLINMSSGIGELGTDPSNDIFSDEANIKTGTWTRALSKDEKLAISNSYSYYPWEPGEVLRYRTVDTFTLAAAMDAIVKQREGSDVNLWDLYTQEVLNPIGITVLPAIHTIEENGARGVPLLGTGLFPTAIDTALIGQLLQNKGVHQGENLLNTEIVSSALQGNKNNSLPVFNSQNQQEINIQYRFSFWLHNGSQNYCTWWIPRMSGYGGNFVQLFPNGVTFFVYQDAFTNDFATEAEAIAYALNPNCP